MKKMILLGIFIFLGAMPLRASVDGRTEHNGFVREGMVLGRGIVNLGGAPLEVPMTLAREIRLHHWLWPTTYLGRFSTNLVTRLTSGINDIVCMPWIVPFTNDISPITEGMELPNYPWQMG